MTPFVFVPGLNADARVYRDIVEALWPLGPVQVANHLEGNGMADIAARILEAAPSRFALGGLSFGGYLCFEILRQARERVTKLALIDTMARSDTPQHIETRRRRVELAKAGKFGLVVEQSFAAAFHPDHADDEGFKAIHRTMSLSNGADVYVRHQEAIIGRPDSTGELSLIDVPTVIIVGEVDAITPPDAAREMHAGIKRSKLVVIPRAGHLAQLEQPEAVCAALVEWAES